MKDGRREMKGDSERVMGRGKKRRAEKRDVRRRARWKEGRRVMERGEERM